MGREGTRTALKLTALVALTIATVVTPQPNPASASAAGTLVVAISAGAAHTCAVTQAGSAKCWGDGNSGQLGDGIVGGSPIPVDVIGLNVARAIISAGDEHTCALTTVGGVKCWGRNILGELGTDTRAFCFFEPCTPFPEDVRELASGVAAIAAGAFHTCVVTTAGGLKCWGNGEYGQVGDGTVGDGDPLTLDNQRLSPVQVIGLESGVAASAAGSFHSCALTTTGGVKCWGQNDRGQLGDGQACGTACPSPVNVAGLDSGVAAITGGFGHTCAVTTAGRVKCWGENGTGGLGDGTTTRSLTPVDVCQDYDEPAQQCLEVLSGVGTVAAGGGHTCGLTTAGGVKCWGLNNLGQLGDGLACGGLCLTPVDAQGLSDGVAAVAAGNIHTCALTTSGGVKCWGDGSFGQLGDDFACHFGLDRSFCPTPVDVIGLEPKAAPTPTTTQTPAAPAAPTALPTEPLAASATPSATPTAPVADVTLPLTGISGSTGGSVAPWAVAALAGVGAAAAGCAALRLRGRG